MWPLAWRPYSLAGAWGRRVTVIAFAVFFTLPRQYSYKCQQFSYFVEKPLELALERKPFLLIFVRVDVFLTAVDKIAVVFGLNLIVATP